jgi:hypothetical protein
MQSESPDKPCERRTYDLSRKRTIIALQGFCASLKDQLLFAHKYRIERTANACLFAEALKELPTSVAPSDRPQQPLLELADSLRHWTYLLTCYLCLQINLRLLRTFQ